MRTHDVALVVETGPGRSSLEAVMRQCIWCEADISADGMAVPVLYSRASPHDCDWQCSDQHECFDRQVTLQDALCWPDHYQLFGRRVEDVPVLADYL